MFAPRVIYDAFLKHRLQKCRLVLVDPNFDTANDMAGVARRMAQDSGLEVEIEVHGDRRTALPKADAVILSAAVEGARRWTMDRDILVRHGLPDQTGECGGVGGFYMPCAPRPWP